MKTPEKKFSKVQNITIHNSYLVKKTETPTTKEMYSVLFLEIQGNPF